jgi:hypothetical protein
VFKDTVNRTAEQMVADGTLFVRGLRSMAEAIATRFKGQKKYADKFGLELVAYEGGQHLAAAVWGVYRANLKNQPLIKLLKQANRSPEMTDL